MTKNSVFVLKKSIILKIFIPIILLIGIQSMVLFYTISQLGTTKELEKNSYDQFYMAVQNKRKSLEYAMWSKWSDMTYLSESILQGENLYQDSLQNNSPLKVTTSLAEQMIQEAKQMDIDGVFIILDNGETQDSLYLRDLKSDDFVIAVGSEDLVDKLGYEKSVSWHPEFDLTDDNEITRNYKQILEKIKDHNQFTMYDLGKWTSSFRFGDLEEERFVFMIPLIYNYDNSQSYGAIGIDISMNSLSKYLNFYEFSPLGKSSCSLVQVNGENNENFHTILNNGGLFGNSVTKESKNIYYRATKETVLANINYGKKFSDFKANEKNAVLSASRLNIANLETPFEDEWMYFVVAVDKQEMLRSAEQLKNSMKKMAIFFLVMGLFTAIIVTWRVSDPIKAISKELMEKKDFTKPIHLTKVNINEIDYLIDRIEGLNKDLIHSSLRMIKTMDATNTAIGTIEIDEEKDSVVCLGKIGSMLRFSQAIEDKLIFSVDEYKEKIKQFLAETMEYFSEEEIDSAGKIITYQIFQHNGINGETYISFRQSDLGTKKFIVVLDETKNVLEKQKIEHDRDYDYLTGLLNRRAFKIHIERLLPVVKCGIMVMWDLDNLKSINDEYGHDAGDKYIVGASQIIKQIHFPNSIIARVSGDEFFLFVYDYVNKENMLKKIMIQHNKINRSFIDLYGEKKVSLSASAGIAFYPEDSATFEELIKNADIAMYQSKNKEKGTIGQYHH